MLLAGAEDLGFSTKFEAPSTGFGARRKVFTPKAQVMKEGSSTL